MSIYFNFNKCRIEFVLQQNKKEYFAVNFLNTHCDIDFSSIVDEVLGRSDFPIDRVRRESHIVVLPTICMGYGMLSVPKSFFNNHKDFETKFNSLYNKMGNMSYDKFHLYTKEGANTFSFTTYRKDILLKIQNAFKKYNIKVVGFTSYARAVNKFVCNKMSDCLSQNFLAVYGDVDLSISANIGSKVVSSIDKKLSSSNILAKIFVESTLENSAKHIKDNSSHNDVIAMGEDERVSLFLQDYENFYKNNCVQFSIVINLTKFNITNSRIIVAEEKDVLLAVDKSIILGKKEIFF